MVQEVVGKLQGSTWRQHEDRLAGCPAQARAAVKLAQGKAAAQRPYCSGTLGRVLTLAGGGSPPHILLVGMKWGSVGTV